MVDMAVSTTDELRLFSLGFLVPVFLIGLAGCLLLTWTTQERGLAVCPDGRTYLTSARLISEGRGYRDFPHGDDWLEPEPVTQFPPLYPMFLALGRVAGLQENQGARILQIVLYMGNVTLLGWMVARVLRSRPSGWLAAALFAFAPTFLYAHLWVWSEPLCFLLMISCLFNLARFETSASWQLLALATLFCGLALLTRFAALSLLLCCCGLLLVGRGELRARMQNSAAMGAFGALVFGGWMLRNVLVAERATAFEQHVALSTAEYATVQRTMSEWVLPLPIWTGFKVAALLFVLGLACFAFVRAARVPAEVRLPREHLAVMGGTLALVHFAFVLASRRLVGTALEPNDRILGPTLLGLIMLGVSSVHGRGRYVLAVVACVWLAGSVLYLLGVHEQGLAYMGVNWR